VTNGLCPFTVQGGEDFTGTAMITVLAQINTLPGTQCQSPCRHRQTDLTTKHAGLEVRREVVQAFVVMLIAVCSLWDQTIEKSLAVATYRRIGVLVDGQRRRGMLQPQMQQTDPALPEFRQASE